jgi:alpha-amylase
VVASLIEKGGGVQRGVMFQYFEWNCRADGSLWRELAGRARELANLGTTAVWMPPAFKAMDGATTPGTPSTTPTTSASSTRRAACARSTARATSTSPPSPPCGTPGMHAYADVVLNHRMGGDETEGADRGDLLRRPQLRRRARPYTIRAWSHYKFPRAGPASIRRSVALAALQRVRAPTRTAGRAGKIYRVVGKTFSGEVCFEYGNFDYLMGADVDTYHPEVREDLFRWGQWFIDTAGVDGFRLDAVKHIPASFYKDWFAHVRLQYPDRELFGVGEYWSGDLNELKTYLDRTDGVMRLFDVPLHFNLRDASQRGRDYDLSKIFDGTLLQDNPLMAVTFVDNHDSQPGQSLESWVQDWFKPLAYALILLRATATLPLLRRLLRQPRRRRRQPRALSHRKLIDDMLQARAKFAYGEQTDYFDHPTCVGWTWSGDAEHPAALAVLMSTGRRRHEADEDRPTGPDVPRRDGPLDRARDDRRRGEASSLPAGQAERLVHVLTLARGFQGR